MRVNSDGSLSSFELHNGDTRYIGARQTFTCRFCSQPTTMNKGLVNYLRSIRIQNLCLNGDCTSSQYY